MGRSGVRARFAGCATALVLSCTRGDRAPANDTDASGSSPASRTSRAGTATAAWDTIAGQLFAIPTEGTREAYLIDPAFSNMEQLDTMQVAATRFEGLSLRLMSGADSISTVLVTGSVRDSTACGTWPIVRFGATAMTAPRGWRIAFPPGRVTGLAVDSLAARSSADSARLTIAIAGAASRIRGDTAAVFRGRPFVVRQADRFQIADNRYAILAEVVRVVPQEANPLHEQLVMILETAADSTDYPAVAFFERSIELEESLASVELLGAVQLDRNGQFALLVRRDVERGFQIELYERMAPNHWTLPWRSAYAGC